MDFIDAVPGDVYGGGGLWRSSEGGIGHFVAEGVGSRAAPGVDCCGGAERSTEVRYSLSFVYSSTV